MAYAFKHITVFFFDIHPIVSLLKGPAASCFQPAFAFLADKQKYQQESLNRTAVTTNSFVFSALPTYEMVKSHFWHSYSDIAKDNSHPDYWRLQLPFTGRVRDTGLRLKHPWQGLAISAFPSLYLTGVGWSVNLKIEIKGDIKKADLITLIGWLARGEGAGFSFSFGGGGMDRKGLFRMLNDRMVAEVFPPGQPPHAGMKTVSQFLISLNSYEGDLKTYAAMPTDEKALMRSILFGRAIDPVDLAKEETNRPLLKTQITTSDTNFSLTNFDYGSLLFLQREARIIVPPKKENKRKVECFATNCKNFLMMMHLLLQFRSLPGTPAPTSDLGSRQEELRDVLDAIPAHYSNLFCQAVYKHHKDLAE